MKILITNIENCCNINFAKQLCCGTHNIAKQLGWAFGNEHVLMCFIFEETYYNNNNNNYYYYYYNNTNNNNTNNNNNNTFYLQLDDVIVYTERVKLINTN